MGDIGAVANAAQAIVDAGVKVAERHDQAERELDSAVTDLRAPLPEPVPASVVEPPSEDEVRALRAIANAKNADEVLTAWGKYRAAIAEGAA